MKKASNCNYFSLTKSLAQPPPPPPGLALAIPMAVDILRCLAASVITGVIEFEAFGDVTLLLLFPCVT